MRKFRKELFLMTTFFVIVVLFFSSCAKKPIAQSEEMPAPQQLEEKRPELWMVDTYPQVDPTDPITFFNEFEINVIAEIPNQITMFKDGDTYKIDSSTVITYTVPALTPGILTEVIKGKLRGMMISFSADDENYTFGFFETPEKTFSLNLNKKIVFEGKPYTVKASVKGGGSRCRLLSNFYNLKLQKTINSSAGGRNAVGTKIVK